MKTLCLFLLLACSLKASTQTLWTAEDCYPKRETRAVWVTTLGGLDWPKAKATGERGREEQKRELCVLMDQLKAAGVNTLLLQVRTRGSVLYPSAIEPWDIALTGQYGQDPGYDPLAFAVEQAHRRGLELEAWVVSVPAFKVGVAQRMGKQSLYNTHRALLLKHEGMYYLDPGEPETAAYIASICEEITRCYDIDGIHLDYIRYPEKAASFPDAASYRKYGKGLGKADWRRGNITSIVREVSQRVKAAKPWVRVTCSPVGKYRDTRRASSRGWNGYDAVYQDSKLWLREGLVDELYPMMYFTGSHFYPFLFDWQEDTGGRLVTAGLGIYFLSPSEKDWPLSVVTRELCTARHDGLSGQAFFRSAFLTANVKGLLGFLSSFYAYPALHPARTWADSVAPSAPSSFQQSELDRQMVELRWDTCTDNLCPNGVRYNVYASPGFPVDVDRAENLVATCLTEPCYTFNRRLGLNLAVTALDRCGNESAPLQIPLVAATPTTAPQPHYLPTDGKTLALPSSAEAEQYVITDLTGRPLLTGRWQGQVDISRLPRGVYRLCTQLRKGSPRFVAEFRK